MARGLAARPNASHTSDVFAFIAFVLYKTTNATRYSSIATRNHVRPQSRTGEPQPRRRRGAEVMEGDPREGERGRHDGGEYW